MTNLDPPEKSNNAAPLPASPRWPAWGAGFAAAAALLLWLHEHGRVIRLEWLVHLVWLAPPMLAFFFVRRSAAAAMPATETEEEAVPLSPSVRALLMGLFVSLFSSAVLYKWFFFLNWLPDEGHPSFPGPAGISWFCLLWALCYPFCLGSIRRLSLVLFLMLIASQCFCARAFLSETGGWAPYNQDHPSFMYRLWIFGRAFLQLTNYSPVWNAGTVEVAGTATGVNAPGLLFWPLWHYLPVERVYPFAMAAMFIVGVPWIGVASARLMGLTWPTAWIAGLLALGTSRYYFLWLLNYGTIGGCFSSVFIMLVAALFYRVIAMGDTRTRTGIALIAATALMLTWPPAVFMLLAVAVSFVFHVRHWTRRKLAFLAVCGLATAILIAPQVLCLVHRMAAEGEKPWRSVPRFTAIDHVHHDLLFVRDACKMINPVILFLGIGGLAAIGTASGARRWTGPAIAALFLIVLFGPVEFPNVQLHRMIIPMTSLAALPAGAVAATVLATRDRRLALARSLVLSLLLLGGITCERLFAGWGLGPYEPFSKVIREMTAWFRDNTPEDARIVLAGEAGLKYEHGYVGYLPVLSGREMFSNSYSHDQKEGVANGCPPDTTPDPDWPDEFDMFLEAYGARYILTWQDEWKAFLSRARERYEQVATFGKDGEYAVFLSKPPASRFVEGAGAVRARVNRLHVYLDDPERPAVIRYRWAEGLRAKGRAEVFPAEFRDGIKFIGIRPNGERDVTIVFRPRLWF